MVKQQHATIWVCSDCMFHAANGECSACPHEREPWSHANAELSPTMGMVREDHECGWQDDPDSSCWESCECETQEFSWSACEGCGSTLGGSRHAFTAWWNDETKGE